jgi:hypothetical protein
MAKETPMSNNTHEIALLKELNNEALKLTEKAQQQCEDLKVKGEKLALALRRLSRSVSVHPEFSNESEWGDYVSGAEKSLNEWEGLKKLTPEEVNQRKEAIEWYRNPAGKQVAACENKEQYELVFAPCAENDPRSVGAYASHDGQSHCNVREMYVPISGEKEPVESKNVVDRLRQIQLCDIDAPIFTHTKEFAAHFSYIKGKLIDILKQQTK